MDHSPYIRRIPNSKDALLMVHGIAGSPAQFRGLYGAIPENWSVYNILLDGHNGTVKDFARSSMAKWKAQVAAQTEQLLAQHQRILIVAHSMGTLFAIDAAIRHPEQISGLFLLQVPLTPHLPLRTCMSSLRVAFGRIRPGSQAEAMANATGIQTTPCLWQYLAWLPRFVELFREIYRTKKLLPQLTVPTQTFQSVHDELVSIRACRFLQGHPCIRNTILPSSGHFSYGEKDLALLNDRLREWIAVIEKQPST